MHTRPKGIPIFQFGNKKKTWMVAGTVFIAMILIILTVMLALGNEQAITINGVSISLAEFEYYLRNNRSDIIAKYTALADIEFDDQFWSIKVDGTTPVDAWVQDSLDACIHDNIVYQMGKQKNLTEIAGYHDMIKAMNEENKRRKKAVQNNEVIYGPEQYDITTYFKITQTNLLSSLEKEYAKQYTPSEEDMRAYYEENKASFKQQDIRVLQQISIPYGEGKIAQEKAEEVAKNILNDYKAGGTIGTIMEKYADFAELADKEYDRGRDDRTDVKLIPQTYASAVTLREGEISHIINENGSYYINICTAIFLGQDQSFEGTKDYISKELTSKSFEDSIQKKVFSARVEKNDGIIKKATEKLAK